MKKVWPFVVVDDYNPDALRIDRGDLRETIAPAHRQLNLFDVKATATFGEF